MIRACTARVLLLLLLGAIAPTALPVLAAQEVAQGAGTPEHRPGGEVNLRLPDLNQGDFLGFTGHEILLSGLLVCVLGLLFGLWSYTRVKNLPVHRSMAEISELIYVTCKAYMRQQGKLLLALFGFIGTVIVIYFVVTGLELPKIAVILLFSLIGMGGSYGVAWFGIRINTLANSRTAFASLRGKAWPVCDIPLRAGMSVGMMLISVELLFMLAILLFIPADVAGACFLGFAIGESLGAAALRIAGGIFTKIADIGSDLMKVVFKIKEDDARNPGVIADCVGDNAGDSVGPTADGFETYGVTGVALISFIVLAVTDTSVQAELLVWIFLMRVMMVLASGFSYLINNAISQGRYGNATRFNFETPLTQLVWFTSLVSVALTYLLSYVIIPDLGGNSDLWWQLST
ncbi:MAG: hppA, partial [Geminicoccaceae bacterium]|nr:hppA [Geminicoccaceae bacterium]